MTHIITIPPKPIQSKSTQFWVHQVPAAKDNLIWMIEYEKGKCAVVDGPSAKEALEYCQEYDLVISVILNTHTHWDHVGINKDLHKKGMMNGVQVYGSKKRASEVPFLTMPLVDGDSVHLGPLQGKVWLTEGHIDGHLSYIFDEFLFCGDTMFAGGCGYLFDGPPEKMHHSLQRLVALPPDTFICCAHEYTEDNLAFASSVDPENTKLQERNVSVKAIRAKGESTLPSTIGLELETNPFVRVGSAEEFRTRRELKNTGAYRK